MDENTASEEQLRQAAALATPEDLEGMRILQEALLAYGTEAVVCCLEAVLETAPTSAAAEEVRARFAVEADAAMTQAEINCGAVTVQFSVQRCAPGYDLNAELEKAYAAGAPREEVLKQASAVIHFSREAYRRAAERHADDIATLWGAAAPAMMQLVVDRASSTLHAACDPTRRVGVVVTVAPRAAVSSGGGGCGEP